MQGGGLWHKVGQAYKQELSGLCHQLALVAAFGGTLLVDAHHTQVMPIEALPLRVPPPRSNRLGQSPLPQFADLVVRHVDTAEPRA